jgi:protein SCO1/2
MGWLWLWPAGLLCLVLATALAVLIAVGGDEGARQVDFGRLLDQIGIDPQPGAQVPLGVRLRDEQGQEVLLGSLCGDKPVILALVYYRCPKLCNLAITGLVRGLRRVTASAGRDFNVLLVSFDPSETAAVAAAARQAALALYERPGAEPGWRFLTGDNDQVRQLADAVGFRYQYDPVTGQFAHSAGVMVLAPGGSVSRYLYGVEFAPRDLRLALVEASAGRIGTARDRVLLLCYHYDPATGKYGLAIMHILRFAGLTMVVGLALGIGGLLWRERRRALAGDGRPRQPPWPEAGPG